MIERLLDGSSALWSAVGTHLWQSTLILLLLALVASALRGAPARLVGLFLWIALLKLFLPLQWTGRVGEAVATAMRGLFRADPAAAADWGAVRVWFYPDVLQVSASTVPSAWQGLHAALSVGWVIGVTWLLLRPLRMRQRRKVGFVTPVGEEHGLAERRLAAALEGTSVPRGAIVPNDRPEMPHVRGWWSPRIHVSRAAIESLEVDDLRAVLLHEDAHRRRRDPLRFLALRLAGALLFFYPPVWWLIRRIRETTEMACDEAVLDAGLSADAYAGSLARALRLGLAQAGPATAIHGHRSSLRERFARLHGHGRFVIMNRHRIALAAAVLIVVVASFVSIAPTVGAGADAALSNVPPVRIEGLTGLDRTVELNFRDTRLATVLDTLGRRAGFDVEIDASLRNERITLRLDGVTVGQALATIARQAALAYAAPRPGTLRVERAGPLLAGVGGVTNPTLILDSRVSPEYPESMREAKLEGHVILQAVIDEAGNVGDISVLRASLTDHDDMAASAIDAIRQWRYQPATLDGMPVAAYFTIYVEYTLK